MHKPKVDRSIREAIVAEYLSGGVTLRELEKKYGHNFAIIGRWVRQYKHLPGMEGLIGKAKEVELELSTQDVSQQVKDLQDQLRMSNLKNELLESLLEIGKEQYGLDLRKKSGTKQS